MENNNNNQVVDTQTTNNQNEVKTFTQEEVNELIANATKDLLTQDKVNEIVKDRVAKEKAKAEKERTQAEELARLSAEERKAKEFEIEMAKKTEEFNTQMAEFTKMKVEFERSQLIAQTQKELSAKSLPIDMANQLVGADAETTMKNIEAFEKSFNESLQKAIDDKLKNSSSSPRQTLKGDENQNISVKDMSLSQYIAYKESQED